MHDVGQPAYHGVVAGGEHHRHVQFPQGEYVDLAAGGEHGGKQELQVDVQCSAQRAADGDQGGFVQTPGETPVGVAQGEYGEGQQPGGVTTNQQAKGIIEI